MPDRLADVIAFMLTLLGMVWTLPNTLLGMVIGLIAMLFGARPVWQRNVLCVVFKQFPRLNRHHPGGAMVLGNVILCTDEGLDHLCHTYAHRSGECEHPPILLADHERAHVLQYMLLGPFFLPLYLLCGGVSARNRFERAADVFALTGRGWWPWVRAK